MRILIVGAGALGQPFGYHLNQGGAEVAYSVKPEHCDECESGFTLHRYRMFGRPNRLEFDDYEVYVDYDEISELDWDQVWLCVSSTAVRGDWLPALMEAVGETTLVSIQPGLEVREHLESHYPAERIVSGRVSMIAWPTPLGDESLPEGDIAYFLPPAQPVYFGGGAGRAGRVAELLDDGGCPAATHDEVLSYGAFTSAILETAVAGLEVTGWSLRAFRRSEMLETAAQAGSEALRVVAAKYDRKPPWMVRIASRPFFMRLGLPVFAFVLPFDLEAYLEEHFTKVGDQTREEIVDFIESGEMHGLEVGSLRSLLRALPDTDGSPAALDE